MLKKIRSGITRRPSTDQAPPAPTAAAAAPPPPIAESVGSSGYLVDGAVAPRRPTETDPALNPDVSSGLETITGAVAPRRPTAEVRTIPTLPGVSTIPVLNPDVSGSPGLETITDSTNSTPAVPAADAASPAATPYEEVNVSPEILKDATTPAAAPASAPVMSSGGRVETVPVRRPSRDVGDADRRSTVYYD